MRASSRPYSVSGFGASVIAGSASLAIGTVPSRTDRRLAASPRPRTPFTITLTARAEQRRRAGLPRLCRPPCAARMTCRRSGTRGSLGGRLLREQLEVADQALVALDRVFLVQRPLLLLDQQDVGVGGLVDAEVPILALDVGQLGGERRRGEAVAGVDHLDEALRRVAGLLQFPLIGG